MLHPKETHNPQEEEKGEWTGGTTRVCRWPIICPGRVMTSISEKAAIITNGVRESDSDVEGVEVVKKIKRGLLASFV